MDDKTLGEGDTKSPPPRKRGRLNNDRWEAILTAASEVFVEKGYRAATVEDVAVRVGLLPGSLYYYISSKEDLFFELATQLNDRWVEWAQETPSTAAADAPSRLACLVHRWMDAIRAEHPQSAWNLLGDAGRILDEERIAQLKIQRHRFRGFVEGILTQGVEAGDFDPGIDSLAVVVNSAIRLFWSVSEWYDADGPESFDNVTRFYTRFILRGLGCVRAVELEGIGPQVDG